MNKHFSVKKIAILGVLLGLNLVLSQFSIHTWDLKIGFAFVTIVVAAVLYGPVEAAIIGGLGDILGWVINPIGAYFPGFTVTAILTGICFGLLLHKNISLVKIIIAAAINQFFIGLVLNTICIMILYGSALAAILPARAIQSAALFVVQALVIIILQKLLFPRLKKVAV